jgi:intracellular septation protein
MSAERPSSASPSPEPTPGEKPNGAKLLIELAPLIVFFAAWSMYGMKTAAGALAVSTILSVAAAWFVLRHVPTMLWVTAVIAVATASLTYVLDDPRFIKMKPTVVNLLFAGALGVGMLIGKPFLKVVLGEAFRMTEEGWRKLTIRWIFFFIAMAVLNEIVWRTMSEGTWVSFKVFGLIPLSIAFTIAQMPLMARHAEPLADK